MPTQGPALGMKLGHLTALESFGSRSLVIHGVMVLAFVNAIFAGLFVAGQVGLVSFVALLNFTAGLWVAHTIHSLGNAIGDDEYAGVLNELAAGTGISPTSGRFGRLLVLIAGVTATSLLTAAQVLPGRLLQIAVVAVGTIAVVTAICGFLIALGAAYDEGQPTVEIGESENATDGIGDA